MPERIDHVARSEALLAAADEHPHDPDVPVDPWVLQAQVHATLALRDEMRTSNLIAFAASMPQGTEMLLDTYHKGGVRSYLIAEIREALGLS